MNDYDEFKRFCMADEQTEEQIHRAHKLEEKVDKLEKELDKKSYDSIIQQRLIDYQIEELVRLREENRVLKEQLNPYKVKPNEDFLKQRNEAFKKACEEAKNASWHKKGDNMDEQLVFKGFHDQEVKRLEQTIDLYKAELEEKDEEIAKLQKEVSNHNVKRLTIKRKTCNN